MLNSLVNTLGFQPPPPIYSEIANISKCAQRMISKFFVLKLYISWGPRTPKKLEDLLQKGWRLVKSTVGLPDDIHEEKPPFLEFKKNV